MDDLQLSIQSLSDTAIMLEQARKDMLKRYSDYMKAKELHDTIRFQLQADLARYGEENNKDKEK